MARICGQSERLNEGGLERLETIAELDASRGFLYDGFTSVSAFLVDRCGLGVNQAQRMVFLARALGHMTQGVKLCRGGKLTVAQLEVLAHAQTRHPQPFATEEAFLSETVTGLSLGDTRRAVEYWCRLYDGPQQVEATEPDPSAVHLSETLGGRGRLDGDLAPEGYALLK
ncbi:MAG TPA: hypothetical protein VE173_02050, partial [Longimicrobiales bacterium]|nr:hypothetical protein [Longimicrobiales bacterium]